MKKISSKVFWSILLFISFIIGMALALIFLISLIIGLIIFWPFLPHMPIVLNFFLREYEFECNILRVLNLARFDTQIKDGWMAPLEILYAVEEISGRQPSIGAIYVTLEKLRREGAVISSKVPAEYLKKPPKRVKAGDVTLAFKLDNNSNYKPRKPKWLPKKKKKEDIINGVPAH